VKPGVQIPVPPKYKKKETLKKDAEYFISRFYI
jgi:hypothetical protein